MSTTAMALRQAHFELRSFRRNVSAMVFTFLFPIMFLLIFGIGGSGRTIETRGDLDFIQFFVPGMLAFGIVSSCYTSLAMRITMLRDRGVLKRVRGTPIPSASYVGGHIVAAGCIAVFISAVTIATGVFAYGVDINTATLPALAVSLVVGAASFCAIGVAMATVVPNADSAPAIVNFTMFPILFISDVFYAMDTAPRWLVSVADVFPIKHLANALQHAFHPATAGPGLKLDNLAVLLLWGVAAGVFAVRRFRWENERSS